MNKNEAFQHFLEHVAPTVYEYHTVASWKSRFNNNKVGGGISDKKIAELLQENGYKAQTFERWTAPGQHPEFTIMFTDKKGVGCSRLTAKNLHAAYEQVRAANPERKNLTDVTYCTIEQALVKLNDVVKFK